jgi:predicted DCC family thiol-disulfide oxidoreductase YuxK
LPLLVSLLPVPLRDAVYDIVARNRYQWFGKATMCRVPSQEEKPRFL